MDKFKICVSFAIILCLLALAVWVIHEVISADQAVNIDFALVIAGGLLTAVTQNVTTLIRYISDDKKGKDG